MAAEQDVEVEDDLAQGTYLFYFHAISMPIFLYLPIYLYIDRYTWASPIILKLMSILCMYSVFSPNFKLNGPCAT